MKRGGNKCACFNVEVHEDQSIIGDDLHEKQWGSQ